MTNVGDADSGTDVLNRQTADLRYYENNVTLNNITTPNNDVSLNSHKITNLANADSSSDAVAFG